MPVETIQTRYGIRQWTDDDCEFATVDTRLKRLREVMLACISAERKRNEARDLWVEEVEQSLVLGDYLEQIMRSLGSEIQRHLPPVVTGERDRVNEVMVSRGITLREAPPAPPAERDPGHSMR